MEQAEGVRIQSAITFVVVTGSRDYHRGTDKRRKKTNLRAESPSTGRPRKHHRDLLSGRVTAVPATLSRR